MLQMGLLLHAHPETEQAETEIQDAQGGFHPFLAVMRAHYQLCTAGWRCAYLANVLNPN